MQDLTQPSPTLWKSAPSAHLLVAAHLYLGWQRILSLLLSL